MPDRWTRWRRPPRRPASRGWPSPSARRPAPAGWTPEVIRRSIRSPRCPSPRPPPAGSGCSPTFACSPCTELPRVIDHDRGALRRQLQGVSTADAVSGAGHQRELSVTQASHSPPPCKPWVGIRQPRPRSSRRPVAWLRQPIQNRARRCRCAFCRTIPRPAPSAPAPRPLDHPGCRTQDAAPDR